MRVLVTGGAGFIGSHLVDKLVKAGHEVTIFDNFDSQVHGENGTPAYLNSEAILVRGDVRDREALYKAAVNHGLIVHLGAAVGVGQSMYQVERYVHVNTLGTAALWDILVNEKHSVEKVIVASSMSIYGEGQYVCEECGTVAPESRRPSQLSSRKWEPLCPNCDRLLVPCPTSEEKRLFASSVYAQTKRHQEEMSLLVGQTYNIPTVALRFFNVYGPRQALSNPYTGVAAIFSSRILNGKPPVIFEDGLQRRDFIHVSDIVHAITLAMASNAADYKALNVGTGRNVSVRQVAETLLQKLNSELEPQITNQFREGDVRHCYADITKIRELLGFEPKVSFEDGMEELVAWLKEQQAVDSFDRAHTELKERSLTW